MSPCLTHPSKWTRAIKPLAPVMPDVRKIYVLAIAQICPRWGAIIKRPYPKVYGLFHYQERVPVSTEILSIVRSSFTTRSQALRPAKSLLSLFFVRGEMIVNVLEDFEIVFYDVGAQ
jgi:hypothetical protein